MEYVQVAIDARTPIAPPRLWQPLLGLFLVPEGATQRFLLADHHGLSLYERFSLAAPLGALNRHTADVIEAHVTDGCFDSLIHSVGIQSDIGVLFE